MSGDFFGSDQRGRIKDCKGRGLAENPQISDWKTIIIDKESYD